MKRVLYIIFILTLLLPTIQQNVSLIKIKKLKGAFTKESKPTLSNLDWHKGIYQNKYNNYFNDHIGFKSFFVRSYNQIHFSLFDIAKSPRCVIGQDKQLFLKYYVESYLGKDLLSKKALETKIDKLKFVSDILKENGISLITIMAPGKGSFHSDRLPLDYIKTKKTTSNYDFFSSELHSRKMKIIDFNQHFLDIKDNSKYDLYPQNGGHWTDYGVFIAADSILHYLEKDLSIEIPDMYLDSVYLSDSVNDAERDIEETMNLLFEISQPKFPSIKVSFENNLSKTKPKILSISDSYYWPMMRKRIYHNLFTPGGFLYYFNTSYPENIPVKNLDLKAKILDQDAIFLIHTEGTLNNYGFGFIEKAYEIFMINDINVLTEHYKEKINNDLKWLKNTEKKAIKEGISLEEQINNEALYMAKTRIEELPDDQKEISSLIQQIKTQKDWYNQILAKAKKRNIHPSLMLYLDAVYISNKRKNK